MTKDQINTAIAGYLQYEVRRQTRKGDPDPNGVVLTYKVCEGGGWYSWVKLPDFYEDLNAMFQAELYLKKNDEHAYSCYCSELNEDFGFMVSIPAAGRAKMFVNIIGKWKGEE